jgi:hypothetical protein
LEIESFVKNIISVDAVNLKLDDSEHIDILLLECLQYALVKEQQVALTYRILPQLRKDVILLPEEIKLSICLLNSKTKMVNNQSNEVLSYHKNIGTVFVLSKEEIEKRIVNTSIDSLLCFEPITTLIPKEEKQNYTRISINTEISIYGEEKLSIDECSLTMNYKLNDIQNIENYNSVTTQYIVNESPTFKVDWN